MKAVRLYEYGPAGNLKYETDVPEPEMGPGDVLIAVAATSINPVDWKMRSGEARERFPVSFPGILGRDVSGVIRAVGADVTTFHPGDRVMAFNRTGTYAELVAMPAAEVTLVPEGLDIVKAAALPLVILTGDQLVREACELKEGQSVIVTGALGSVGRAAVHTAKKLGAHVIAGVRKHSVDEAKKVLGAAAVLATDDPEAVAELGTVDAIADTIGAASTPLLTHLKEGGICGTVVTPPPDVSLNPKVKLVRFRAHPDPVRVREFAEDFRDGRFQLPIVRSFPLSEAAAAQEFAEKGGSGGKTLLLVV